MNESYEIKRIETGIAACLAAFMHDLGANVAWSPSAWDPSVYRSFLNGDRWRTDTQVIDFFYDHHDERHNEGVTFTGVFYGPESDFEEGTPQLLDNVELRDDGKSKLFDNSKSTEATKVAYEESVTLANSVSNHVKESFTFDVTTTNQATVSGEYAGAKLEDKLTTQVHVGESKEKAKDTAESTAQNDKVDVQFDVAAGEIILLEIVKEQKRTLTPVRGVFVADMSIEMLLSHWWSGQGANTKYRGAGNRSFQVESVSGLQALIAGEDTNYPQLEGYRPVSRVRNGIAHIVSPANRSYYLDTDKMRVEENNADYRTSSLASLAHAAGAGLDVVSLDDEAERERYAPA